MGFNYLGSAVSTLSVLLASVYIYIKSTNDPSILKYRKTTVLWCAVWSLLCASVPVWIPPLLIRLLTCMAIAFFIRLFAGRGLNAVLSAYLLSYGISYSLLAASVLLIAFASAPFLGAGYAGDAPVEFDDFAALLIAALISSLPCLFAYLLFKIRRFKNGFPFLLKGYAIIVAVLAAGVVLPVSSLAAAPREAPDEYARAVFFALGIAVTGIGIYIWVRRGITMFHRRKTLHRGMEILEKALEAEREKNRALSDKLEAMRAANHKIMRRLEAMEDAAARQTGGGAAVTPEDVRALGREYREAAARAGGERPLPSTKVRQLDAMFSYFSERFFHNGIDFSLKVSGSIPYMVERVVGREKLETMIGDHLQNALDAAAAGSGPFRGVLAGLGLAEGCYGFTVYDSGIPFEAGTLTRLGAGRVTGRAGQGGSGIGFMTTFETAREYGASLIIREEEPGGAGYTKSVSIRFDGRGRYAVETYRPGAFPPDGRYEVIHKGKTVNHNTITGTGGNCDERGQDTDGLKQEAL